jgi:hypothetical protein
VLRRQYLPLRDRSRDAGPRLCHSGAIIVLDQLREHLPSVNPLEILYRKLAHVAGNLCRNGGEIRLEVRIVRSLPPCAALPTGPISRYHDNDPDGHDEHEDAPGDFKDLVPVGKGVHEQMALQLIC